MTQIHHQIFICRLAMVSCTIPGHQQGADARPQGVTKEA